MSEYDHEPIRGLPGLLPPGERMLWQGSPDWKLLATSALHIRVIAGYFVVLALAGLFGGASTGGVAATLGVGCIAVGLAAAFAYASSRATVYTLTSKRIVLRFGVALPKCINLPLTQIATARVQQLGGGRGDIALALTGSNRIGYLRLWPYARAWRISAPEPMLRSLTDVDAVATLLASTLLAAVPGGRRVAAEDAAHQGFAPDAAAA